ncbi:hypothetical protein Holit_01843 [Hollandina sp. SP2]
MYQGIRHQPGGVYRGQGVLQRKEHRGFGGAEPVVSDTPAPEQSVHRLPTPGPKGFQEVPAVFHLAGTDYRYYRYKKNGTFSVTYLDERLRVEEEEDYLRRIQSYPEGYNQAGYSRFTLQYRE